MRNLFIVSLLFLMSVDTGATELKPFVGTGGQFQLMMLYSYYSDGDPRDYIDIYPSLDPYIEVGCGIGKWEIYGTHEFIEPRGDERYHRSPIDTISLTSESEFSSEHWNNERYCLGVRYRGYDDPIRPLLGVGIEVGRFVQSRRDAAYRNYYEIEEFEWDSVTYSYYNWVNSRLLHDDRDRWKSALNVGGVIEIGVGVSIIEQLEMICATRIHGAYANFGFQDYGIVGYRFELADYTIVSPAFLVQLRYTPFTIRL